MFFPILASSWCEKDVNLGEVRFVQQGVSQLLTDLENMSFESEEMQNNFKVMLKNVQQCLLEYEKKANGEQGNFLLQWVRYQLQAQFLHYLVDHTF